MSKHHREKNGARRYLPNKEMKEASQYGVTLTEYCTAAKLVRSSVYKIVVAAGLKPVGVRQVTPQVKSRTYAISDLQQLKSRPMGRPKGVKDSSPRYKERW